MILSRRIVMRVAVMLAVSAGMTATAHEAPRVETEVTYSAESGLEVTHVLQLTTTQRLLKTGGIIDKPDLTGLKARAELALYVSERFDLIADGQSVPLEILGAEIEGGHVYVYQTGKLSGLPAKWEARNTILRDLNPRFDNIINVPTSGGIRTIVFDDTNLNAVKTTS